MAETMASEEAEAAIWRALSDPTRRRILDQLAASPATTGQVAARFEISRIAVMRHLRVLADAGLVIDRKRGRERWHYVNLVPLTELHQRWGGPAAVSMAAGLANLKGQLEGPVAELRTVDLAFEVTIAADADVVFAAIVDDVGAWWGLPFVTPGTTGLTIDARLGGGFTEHYSDGGRLLATVTELRPGQRIALTGPFHLGPASAIADIDLTETGDQRTKVALSFRGAGLISEEIVEAFGGGWRELITERLKRYVEEDIRLGIDPGLDSGPGGRKQKE